MNGMSWEVLAIAALVLLGLEMLMPMTVFLWMGIGTAAASLVSFYGVGWPGQVFVFLLGTSGSLATYFIRRGRLKPADVSRPGLVLDGLRGTALGEIAPAGRVLVADGSWAARSRSGAAIPDGTAIIVVGHDGATLIVEPSR
ncbi:MAG: NfeD family protein [Rubritepida sp.]|nr:NfeD family protein [Rubritepida sp.]